MKIKTTVLIISIMFTMHLIAQNEVLIPGTLSGTSFELNLQTGTMPFYSGQTTSTMGANGNILGPTLIMQKGDFVDITVNNLLPDTTTIHWHGMHVSASNDGGPHTIITPSGTWNPSFTVMDRAGTYWYHPHLHMKTNEHVSKGIAGFIIVQDDEEAALELPRAYGVDDFPLVIQTKDFDNDNQIVVPSNADDVLMVNATIDPFLDLPAQVVRLRLLNGSSQRVFNIGLSDNQTFYQIGSDDGLLSQPNATTRLRMAPGERVEILLDLTDLQGQSLQLMSFASEFPNGIYGATLPGMMSMMTLDGYNPNYMNGADFTIMEFNVLAPTANPVITIPATLVEINPLPEASANISRTLTFTAEAMGPNALNGKFFINGGSFDMNTINYSIPLDNIEIWTLTNQSPTAHPFHIHDVHFYVLDRNGVPPLASEQGRKDVILVPAMQSARIIMQFPDFANDDVPYMYHCHMLTHEDDGMMGQFEVVDEATGMANPKDNSNELLVSPNPAHDRVTISSQRGSIEKLIIYNAQGKLVLRATMQPALSKTTLDISTFESGVFVVEASGTGWHTREKMIIK